MNTNERYDNLDFLRALSAILIILLHIYANFGFDINSIYIKNIISNFGGFTRLFMILSGFLCAAGFQ